MNTVPIYAVRALAIAVGAPVCMPSPAAAAPAPQVLSIPSITNNETLSSLPPLPELSELASAPSDKQFDYVGFEVAELDDPYDSPDWDTWLTSAEVDPAMDEMSELHEELTTYRKHAGDEFVRLTSV